MTTPEMTPLGKLKTLTNREQNAFLALFAGARAGIRIYVRGDTGQEMPPFFGKAECEWVPFREFWQHKLPSLGLTTFEESEPKAALGMVAGSTFTHVMIYPTEEGRAAREAYWSEVNERSARDDG